MRMWRLYLLTFFTRRSCAQCSHTQKHTACHDWKQPIDVPASHRCGGSTSRCHAATPAVHLTLCVSSKWFGKWFTSWPGRSLTKLLGANSCCTELVDAHQMSQPSSVCAGCHPLASKLEVMTTLLRSLRHLMPPTDIRLLGMVSCCRLEAGCTASQDSKKTPLPPVLPLVLVKEVDLVCG